MRRKKQKSPWQDSRTRQAKKEGYPARSIYKLEEMQEKWRILKPGQRVLDLGSAPGSWLKYASLKVGEKGQVMGVDLSVVKGLHEPNIRVFQGDALDPEAPWAREIDRKFHVVLSDMAPATTGNKTVDTARSLGLAEGALHVADTHLATGGTFICKVFEGGDFPGFKEQVRARFESHKLFKPQGTRRASKEIYIIGFSKKENHHVRTQ